MTKSNILKFEQTADFFFTKYIKCVERGRYLDAMMSLRSAIEKDPLDPEYRLSMAELYTEIGDFEESNFLLFEQLRTDGSFFGDCLFGMGCNFIGLQDPDKAAECFSRYLDAFPGGEYAEDARDFLEMLDDEMYDADLGEYFDMSSDFENVNGFLYYPDLQTNELEELVGSHPDDLNLRNDLGFAYICENKVDDAETQALFVLSSDAHNVGALCNLLTVAKTRDDAQTIQNCLDTLDSHTPAKMDDAYKLVLTYCDVGEHELAYHALKNLLATHPYNVRLLYLVTTACIKTGRRAEAETHLHNMLVIHPENQIASYYMAALTNYSGDLAEFNIDYDYSLPIEEILLRMDELASYLDDSVENMMGNWKDNPRFKELLKWILTLHDTQVKSLALATLGVLPDDEAKQILRRYLMRIDEPDELKHPVFASLKRQGEREPYIAYMSGKCVEVAVGMVNTDKDLSHSEQKVLSAMVQYTPFDYRQCIPIALELMTRYCAHFDKPPIFKATNPWAAAFISIALRTMATGKPAFGLFDAFEMKLPSFERCLKKITDTLNEDDYKNLPEVQQGEDKQSEFPQ